MKNQLLVGLVAFSVTNLQMAAIADQTVISKKKSATPTSQSVDVKHDYTNYRGNSTKEWKATDGSDVSKRAATQTSDVTHSDGTFSSRRNHQSHAVTATGETHKDTKDHKAVSPDGTVTEEHSSTVKTNSNTSSPPATSDN